MRVIADHGRAAAFLIGDGVLPSNEGRGYVLRRIMRRAIRYGRNIGLTRPFLHETARVVFDIMKPAYPELAEAAAFITNVIQNEEARFRHTLDTGLKLLNDTLAELKSQGRTEVPGEVIFKLYDTFGFPADIVRDVVRDERMHLDMDGFEREMEGQRAKSRTVTASRASATPTEPFGGRVKPEFVGYDLLSCEAACGCWSRTNRKPPRRRPEPRSRWSPSGPRSTRSPAARPATRAASSARRARSR